MAIAVRNKKIAVVGMGKSGAAAAELLASEGADVVIVDDNVSAIPKALHHPSIACHLGEWSEADLFAADRVVVSPGFPVSRLPLARLAAAKIPVIGEMELAAERLSAPIIAVTGTNGKSTTTTLIGEILKGWGMRTFVGGNLGVPLSRAVGGEWDFIVTEVSSFQLETIHRFHPRIAVLLNLAPDHCDRYPDFSAYRDAKWRIFENQTGADHAVLNGTEPVPDRLGATPTFFGHDAPPPDRRGIFVRDGGLIARMRGEDEPLCSIDRIGIRGTHNVENAMAAAAVALLCGAPSEAIRQSLATFHGLPHRMERVRTVDGVEYIDDSKGTNVGAVMKSLEGLTSPVILIAGGRDKGSDFSPLREAVYRKVKKLIVLGEASEKIAHTFPDHPAIARVGSMSEAVVTAHATAKHGDVVLLSPACASFDQFKNFEHRGEVFKAEVEKLGH